MRVSTMILLPCPRCAREAAYVLDHVREAWTYQSEQSGEGDVSVGWFLLLSNLDGAGDGLSLCDRADVWSEMADEEAGQPDYAGGALCTL